MIVAKIRFFYLFSVIFLQFYTNNFDFKSCKLHDKYLTQQ